MDFVGLSKLVPVVVVVSFLVTVANCESLEVPGPIAEYEGYRVQMPCRYGPEEGDVWMHIQWVRVGADQKETIIAMMMNGVFVPTWNKEISSEFTDHVELKKEALNKSYSLLMVFDGLMCSDGGIYRCQAFSMDGILSQDVNITVLAHPGVPTIPTDTLQVKENDTFRLGCQANVGMPPHQINWKYTLAGRNAYNIITENVTQVNTLMAENPCSYHGKSSITITMEERLDGAIFACYVGQEMDPTASTKNFDTVELSLYGKTTTTRSTTTPTTMKQETANSLTDTGGATTTTVSLSVLLCSILAAVCLLVS